MFDIFAKPAGGDASSEFLAFHNYTGSIARAHEFAASRGCKITRIIDLAKPIGAPDFRKAVNI